MNDLGDIKMLSADFQKLHIDGLIILYELDAQKHGAGILRFHGHTQTDVIIWQGHEYSPLSIQVSGLERRSDGKASMPKLSIANIINNVHGGISALCHRFADFVDAKLNIITTTLHYLDAVNFEDGNPHASNECQIQTWYIQQKTSENNQHVTFELSNPIDFQGRKLPVRQITSLCHWCMMGEYRGEKCGYIGIAMFDEKNNPVDNPALDKCNGRLSGCEVRKNVMRFGGFPASSLL